MNAEKDVNLELTTKSFDFDKFLQKELGEFGLYQKVIIWLLCVPSCFVSAYNTLDMVFLAYTPEHRCNADLLINLTDNSNYTAEKCQFLSVSNLSSGGIPHNNETVPICNQWTYDQQYFQQTVVTEWNLVCDRELTIRNIISFMNFATLFSMALSFVQDKWGRKRAFLLNLVLFLVGNCSSLFAPNPTMFAFLKFVGGISCIWNICLCWGLEFIGPTKRHLVTTINSVMYAVATVSLALLGYLCDTWRQVAFCTSAPFCILLLYICIVPESPRWLLSQGRVDEALAIVKTIASRQRVNVDLVQLRYEITNDIAYEQKIGKNGRDYIRKFMVSKNLRWKLILITLVSAMGTQLYTAVPYHIEKLQGNFFVAFAMQAAVEAPATLCALFLLNSCGRIVPLTGSMILAGVACLLTWPAEFVGLWGSVVMSTLARFFVCIGVIVSNQLAMELFPTVTRGFGCSVILVSGSLISISIQYILYSSVIWAPLPMLIMGPATLIGGLFTMFLPETKNLPLPDTVEDAESQGSVGVDQFKKNVQSIGNFFSLC